MTIVYVTNANTNKRETINSDRVSRIFDHGSFRELRYGTGSSDNEYSSLTVKETILKLQQDFGFVKVTNHNTKRGAAVNSRLVSYILDSSSFREIWFGPDMDPIYSDTTSTFTVVEQMSYLQPNLGLVLVTLSMNGKKIAVNPNTIVNVENAGSARNLYFGSPTRANTAIHSVKETIAQLQKLGIV